MKKRKLGNSDLEVFPLAFGGNVFGWTADEPTSFALLDRFTDSGFNFVDTADVYSRWVPGNKGGESETIIGKWMKKKGNRNRIIIATKVGNEMGPDKKGLSGAYIVRAVEESLTRLQTDYIDLYQSHVDDPATPMDDTFEAYDRLITQGKVRAIGASNFRADRLSEALRVSTQRGYPRYQTLQPLYNLYDRADYEQELEKLCIQENLGVITYYSLASGFLSGKYRSEQDLKKSARGQGVVKYLTPRGMSILDALDYMAKEYHSTSISVALAWLIARPGVSAPIASATSLEQLDSLTGSVDLTLDDASIKFLNQASSYLPARG